MLMRRILVALSALYLTSAPVHSFEPPGEEIGFENAEFEITREPSKVILHWTQVSQDLYTRSMTVFADGRIELRQQSGNPKFDRLIVQQIDRPQVEEWVDIAVRHGLAEWDPPRIMARQLHASNGRIRPAPVDSPQVTFLIALARYHRGDYQVEPLEVEIRAPSPTLVAPMYPTILELQGLAKLSLVFAERMKALRDPA